MPWFSVMTAIQILKQQVSSLMVITVLTVSATIVRSIIHALVESILEGFFPEISAVMTGKTGIPLSSIVREGGIF